MKYTVMIINPHNKVLYKGKPLDIPVKKEAIVEKSIELFGDDDPCIIHQSYAVQKLINDFMQSFTNKSIINLSFQSIQHDFSFIDIKDINQCYLTVEGKK